MATTVPPDVSTLTCKGTILKASLAFLEQRCAPAQRAQIIARLDAPSRSVLTGLVLPSSRYPLPALVNLLEASDEVLGRGDLALCTEFGRHAADYEVTLLHKVFLAVANLDYWLRMSATMWSFYYGAGSFRHHDMTAVGGVVELSEFNPLSKAFCLRFAGWLHRICEMSRLREVRIAHTDCILDGAPACVWQGRWVS